jgi:hypothetical protein
LQNIPKKVSELEEEESISISKEVLLHAHQAKDKA